MRQRTFARYIRMLDVRERQTARRHLPSIVETGKEEFGLLGVLRLPCAERLDETTVANVLTRGAVDNY